MGLWESVLVSREILADREFLYSVGCPQPSETFNRDLTTSCDKLDELGTLTIVKFLQGFPEVKHRLTVRCVTLVHSVLTQIIDVNYLESRDKELQFPIVENLDQVFWHYRENT